MLLSGNLTRSRRNRMTHPELEKPRQRARSLYAIPALVNGMPNAERLINRVLRLRTRP